jgi:hypothetical protein
MGLLTNGADIAGAAPVDSRTGDGELEGCDTAHRL